MGYLPLFGFDTDGPTAVLKHEPLHIRHFSTTFSRVLFKIAS